MTNFLKFIKENPDAEYYEHNDRNINISIEYRYGLALWTPQLSDTNDANELLKLFASYGCYRNYVEYYPISKDKFYDMADKTHGIVFIQSDKIFFEKSMTVLLKYMMQNPGAHSIVFCEDGDFTTAGQLLDYTEIQKLYLKILEKITANSPIIKVGYHQLGMSSERSEKQLHYLRDIQAIPEDSIYHKKNYLELKELLLEHDNVHLYVYSLSNFEDKVDELLSLLSLNNHTLYILKHDDMLMTRTHLGLKAKEIIKMREDYIKYLHWKNVLSCYQDKNIKDVVKNNKTKSNLEKVIELREAGKTQKEIAAETGLSVPTISRLYRKINRLEKI